MRAVRRVPGGGTGSAGIAVLRWGGARRAVSAVPGQRFCRACGRAGRSPAARHAPAPGRGPVAERRVCSVLFCDVVGFTPLSEARDPEAVRELLSRYFGVARTVIGRYGGVVEKFIGDAVMAVWGTPAADRGRCGTGGPGRAGSGGSGEPSWVPRRGCPGWRRGRAW